jgi:iron/zinc/copper transport system substrate-binding protein
MKKLAFLFIAMVLVLAGCGTAENVTEDTSVKELQIVTTTSILADLAQNIAGDRTTVSYIIPIGESPEDYELLPSDMKKMNNADVVFTNGLGLEAMIEKVLDAVTDTTVRQVSHGVVPILLVGEDEPDPHAWLDVRNAILYVENILEALVELDPEGEDVYRANAAQYIEKLTTLHQMLTEQAMQIPEGNRLVIISENALKYFGEAYGFQTEGIWELNAHEEGTPQQITRIIELVRETSVPGLFIETTVDSRYMEMIAAETGVPIMGELYTDALGAVGSEAETYISMMTENMAVLLEGLGR